MIQNIKKGYKTYPIIIDEVFYKKFKLKLLKDGITAKDFFDRCLDEYMNKPE